MLLLLVGCGETTRQGDQASGGGAMGGEATNSDAAGATAPSGAAGHDVASGSGGSEPTEPEPRGGRGGAGPGAAGEAGAGGSACAESVPRCEPGEPACDPRLGKLGTCDACGAVTDVDEAGADCVRLIASDKESNGVCAVLGSDRLECFPEAFQIQKTTIPPDVIALLLPDDYPYGTQREPCLLDSSGTYSCLLSRCDGRVVVGETGACGLCDGKVFCSGGASGPATVQEPIDLSLTDGNLLVLSPLGVHAHAQEFPLPSGWRGAPARLLVDHQEGGCVISDRHELACWTSVSHGIEPAKWEGGFQKIIGTTLPRACALDAARQLRCGNVFEDVTPAPYGDADTVDFVASSSVVCSLSVAGRVKCWNEATGEPRGAASGW